MGFRARFLSFGLGFVFFVPLVQATSLKSVEVFLNSFQTFSAHFVQTNRTNQGVFHTTGQLWFQRPSSLTILMGDSPHRQKMLFNQEDVMIREETPPDPQVSPEVLDLFQTPIRYLLTPCISLSDELESGLEEKGDTLSVRIQQRCDMTGGSLVLVFKKNPETSLGKKRSSQPHYPFTLQGWVTTDPFGNQTIVSFDPTSIQMDHPLPSTLFDRRRLSFP
jgi:outer membrane lipoprotein-sorting protein